MSVIQLATNHNISPSIVNMIKDSEKYLLLVTPYLYPWKHLQKELKDAISRDVRVTLILRPETINKVETSTNEPSLDVSSNNLTHGLISDYAEMGMRIRTCDDLHTKLYLSEKQVIFTSMNLYDHSMKSNEELALISDDKKILKKFTDYASELHSNSPRWLPKGMLPWDLLPARKGYCIRCGEKETNEKYYYGQLDKNGNYIGNNLCDKCLPVWNKYKDKKFIEKYCFDCGQEYKTSVQAPLCKDCTYKRQWFDDEYNQLVEEFADKHFKDFKQ